MPASAPPRRKRSGKSQRVRRSSVQIEALVLDCLQRSNAPISAYDIASRSATMGEAIIPNQIYRTLARLIERGLVLRLESLSAYMLKREPFDTCLICHCCHAVQLLTSPEVMAQLDRCARGIGFSVAKTVVELHGRCADCATSTHPYGVRGAVNATM